MEPWMLLPETPLRNSGPATVAFLGIGCDSFRGAAHHLYKLPYGCNSDRANFDLVLCENRGTCSTKHALLATLALEQDIPVSLTIGIYDMDEANTPGVGGVLSLHGLKSIPEAHCYLVCGAERVDLSRADGKSQPISCFHKEWTISPIQIGAHKRDLHQKYIREWLRLRSDISMPFEELWRVRENCILSLSAA